jgi:hypothetical protein
MVDAKTIKLDIGTIYKKDPKGNYYYRYQVESKRKTVSLKTKNKEKAIAQAKKLVPIVTSTSVEVISAHVKHARGMASKLKILLLDDAWDEYSKKPDRATPATVSEQNAYKSTFNEFKDFINNPDLGINDITPEIAGEFADYMRTKEIAVDKSPELKLK